MNCYKTKRDRHSRTVIEVVAISDKYKDGQGWEYRKNWETLNAAQGVADAASLFEGVKYLAIDKGVYTYPRFDVIRAPQVGDAVSYAFNGDYYPCGQIKTISKSFKKITTTNGFVFYRRKNSGAWLHDGQWSLVKGHRTDRNPHF